MKKSSSQIFRIALLLLAIFAGGVLTGRWTAPQRAPTVVITASGRATTAETTVQRLAGELGLDADQVRRFRSLLEEVAVRMSETEPLTQERLDVFRSAVPRMRAFLRPEQYPAFDRYVERTERKYERRIRKRDQADAR